jgi:hypothetical protein
MPVQVAVSNVTGCGMLSVKGHCESFSIRNNSTLDDDYEVDGIAVHSLDDLLNRYGWHTIDFIKIDAEGEESNIIKGGALFFSQLSPLVMYEVKGPNGNNLELVKQFAAMGYQSYRLLPGINKLFRVIDEEPLDDFVLNLFACKPDRAEKLIRDGFMFAIDEYPVLLAKFKHLRNIANPTLEELAELVQTALDAGYRSVAHKAVQQLMANAWWKTAVLGSRSSCFSRQNTLDTIKGLRDIGYACQEMDIRETLINSTGTKCHSTNSAPST